MIERILQKLYDEYYPDRDIQVLIVNGRVTLAINDTAQASYSIKGTYRYEEVQKLNQFTNGFVQYGLCPGDGPTAIIGDFSSLLFLYCEKSGMPLLMVKCLIRTV